MRVALFDQKNGNLVRHPLSRLEKEEEASLVLCFGDKKIIAEENFYPDLKNRFPSATIVSCSTAGEICQQNVTESSLVAIAIQFSHTTIDARAINIRNYKNSFDAGRALVQTFPGTPAYLMVLSDGSEVNGSELVRGLNDAAENTLVITGGLAGDGNNFESTLTGLNGSAQSGKIIGIAFYGDKLHIGHGSKGGWETFGLQKTVTRAKDNKLYEIEGKNALELYKNYLGPEAASLPGSALLFPLQVIPPGQKTPLVRTILSIDAVEGSMIFAGDIPVGSTVRFMKANLDKITYAASEAALASLTSPLRAPDLALLISCVGRKLILHTRVEEEVEAVDEVFNHKTLLGGFYSYGELCPSSGSDPCQLHNQTMTITTFYEAE